MGTRTMGSHRKSDGLSKQGGVSYNLTLDEIQHQLGDLGKPLKSMNLDELLKNVATADNNQGGSESIMANRQSSLSKKTVDELWQDIQHGLKKMDSVGSSSSDVNGSRGGYNLDDRKSKREKEPTLGEMTLEDFLAKAGIDANSSPEKKNLGSVVGDESVVMPQQVKPQQPEWMQYQIPPFQQRQQQHMFMSGQHQAQQPIMDMDFPEGKMKMCPTPLMGTLSDTQTPGRKRHASGDVIEKTVERRQKRMIKNRESAARSRARKQVQSVK